MVFIFVSSYRLAFASLFISNLYRESFFDDSFVSDNFFFILSHRIVLNKIDTKEPGPSAMSPEGSPYVDATVIWTLGTQRPVSRWLPNKMKSFDTYFIFTISFWPLSWLCSTVTLHAFNVFPDFVSITNRFTCPNRVWKAFISSRFSILFRIFDPHLRAANSPFIRRVHISCYASSSFNVFCFCSESSIN